MASMSRAKVSERRRLVSLAMELFAMRHTMHPPGPAYRMVLKCERCAIQAELDKLSEANRESIEMEAAAAMEQKMWSGKM